MPTYQYSCSKCDNEQDEYRSVERRNDPVFCSRCGAAMLKQISHYKVIGDVNPYYDENLESWVKSRRDRERVMKEKGVYESYGRGWK